LRVKVEIARGKFLLYDGYDWTITRKTIEAEMKAIKRKLQKFKQILASGQTPDESVEVTRTWLYDSVLIGLPEEDLGGDPDTLLAAIENQLEHLDIDTASISPSAPATTRVRDPKTSGGAAHKRRRKLERSSRPQIEISLAGIRIDHTHFKPPAQERARSVIAVANLEIFDHIKTSTWKKFLTHMALSQGQAPETDVDMVQIRVMEMVNEQTGREKQQEYRIKVRVSLASAALLQRQHSRQTPTGRDPTAAFAHRSRCSGLHQALLCLPGQLATKHTGRHETSSESSVST
jgi:autophagy-related protein 2